MYLNNSFVKAQDRIKIIYNHHEQACAMAAEGYAKYTGKMAAVCVTSGPGGLNTINGIQGAWVDSTPMLVLTGHPRYSTTVEASGLKLRCRGVQENDIVTQVKNITKYAKLVKDPLAVRMEVQKAIDIAMSGRRGPVLLSFPLDVQGAEVDEDDLYVYAPVYSMSSSISNTPKSYDPDDNVVFTTNIRKPSKADIELLVLTLKQADRPVILTGSGIRSSGSIDKYHIFKKLVDIPTVGETLCADVDYHGAVHYYGGSGVLGPRCGNFILQNADTMLVLGNSLSVDQIGFNAEGFAPDAKIIMVDIDEAEANKPGVKADVFIHSDLNAFFEAYIEYGSKLSAPRKWISHCDMLYKELPQYEILERHGDYKPKERVHQLLFWKKLKASVENNAVFIRGNSACGYGLSQTGVNEPEQRILVNVHNGSMGNDLPLGIGAAVAANVPIYCVTGDGSIMMNLQELETIAFHQFPIKIVVFNNNGYGNIRNTCSKFFGGQNNGCDPSSGLGFPSFNKLADAFEIPYFCVENVGRLDEGIEWLINSKSTCLMEIMEIIDEERAPFIKSVVNEAGQFVTPPLHVMYPFLDNEKMDKYMIKAD